MARLYANESFPMPVVNRRHFIRLRAVRPEHAGIIACTVDPDFVGQARRIHESIGSSGGLSGQLIRINRPVAGGR